MSAEKEEKKEEERERKRRREKERAERSQIEHYDAQYTVDFRLPCCHPIRILNLTLALASLAQLSMLSALRHGARRLTTQTNTSYKLLVQEAQGLTVVKATSVVATSQGQGHANTFTSLAGKWQAQGPRHQSQCGHGPLCNCKNGEGPFAAYINNNNNRTYATGKTQHAQHNTKQNRNETHTTPYNPLQLSLSLCCVASELVLVLFFIHFINSIVRLSY